MRMALYWMQSALLQIKSILTSCHIWYLFPSSYLTLMRCLTWANSKMIIINEDKHWSRKWSRNDVRSLLASSKRVCQATTSLTKAISPSRQPCGQCYRSFIAVNLLICLICSLNLAHRFMGLFPLLINRRLWEKLIKGIILVMTHRHQGERADSADKWR